VIKNLGFLIREFLAETPRMGVLRVVDFADEQGMGADETRELDGGVFLPLLFFRKYRGGPEKLPPCRPVGSTG